VKILTAGGTALSVHDLFMCPVLGNYQILHPVYQERIGTVHLGRHTILARDVHVLLVDQALSTKESFRTQFLNELAKVGRLHHPNIVRILDIGFQSDILYLVTEYEHGIDSSEVLENSGQLMPTMVFGIGASLCSALIHAHLRGVIHGCLHPGNIMLRPDMSPAIKGFGYTPPPGHLLDDDEPWSARTGPSWSYQAPEMLLGEMIDTRSDLWSLGAVVLFYLTGAPPFAGETREAHLENVRTGRLNIPLKAQQTIPNDTLEMLRQMVAFHPKDRPESLYQVKAAMEGMTSYGAVTIITDGVSDGLEVGARFEPAEGLNCYRIIEKCGEGTYGAVYKVKEESSGEIRALKVLRTQANQEARVLERFEREGLAMRAIDHPNVIRIFEAGHEAGVHYFVMEHVTGHDLREVIARCGKVAPDYALSIARQMALGLQAAHTAGIIHRDLSPANVLIDGTGRVLLTDFGLAHLPDRSRLTASGALMGTPLYLAPETLSGRKADPRSDLYSLGTILYEMLTGQPPFSDGSLWTLLQRILREEPQLEQRLPEGIPISLKALLLRLLGKDPASRYPDAAALLEDLTQAEEDLTNC